MNFPVIASIVTYVDDILRELSNIRRDISAMRDAVQNCASVISDQAKREGEQKDNGLQIVVGPGLRISEDDKKEFHARYKRQYRQQCLHNFITFLAFLAAAIYAGTAYKQLRKMMSATNAAVSSAETSAKQFSADQRPWIALDTAGENAISPYDNVGFSTSYNGMIPANGDQYAIFVLRYALKNTGKSPAKVDIGAEIIGNNHRRDNRIEKIESFCKKDYSRVMDAKHIWPSTLVPGTMNYNSPSSLTISPEQRKRGFIQPTVIGCIWYLSTTPGGKEQPVIHKTPFSGQISFSSDESGPAKDMSPIKIPIPRWTQAIPAHNIKVVDILTMGDAD